MKNKTIATVLVALFVLAVSFGATKGRTANALTLAKGDKVKLEYVEQIPPANERAGALRRAQRPVSRAGTLAGTEIIERTRQSTQLSTPEQRLWTVIEITPGEFTPPGGEDRPTRRAASAPYRNPFIISG